MKKILDLEHSMMKVPAKEHTETGWQLPSGAVVVHFKSCWAPVWYVVADCPCGMRTAVVCMLCGDVLQVQASKQLMRLHCALS